MKLIDTASMKEAERRADAAGLSYYQMMENAGQAAFSLLAGRFSLPGRRVCLLCGRGNNGGDALVMARRPLEGPPKTKMRIVIIFSQNLLT